MTWRPWQAQPSESAGGVPARAAAYLPADLYGFTAQYTLKADKASRSIIAADYSLNANDLGSVNAWTVPDLVPGEAMCRCWDTEGATPVGPAGVSSVGAMPALAYQSELTVVCRAYYASYISLAAFAQYLVANGNFSDGTEAGNCAYALVVPSGTNNMAYFAQTGAGKAAILFQSTLARPFATWFFLALRRTAAGVVTIDIDGSSQTSGALALPTGGTTNRMVIGRPPSSALPIAGNQGWSGAVANVCIKNARLTDAEIAVCRRTMMGL